MCSGTDSYDIALAAEGLDICASEFDHDPVDPMAQKASTHAQLRLQGFQADHRSDGL
jgi:hypothetical protein